jgi:hypothetical protein
MRIEVQEKKEKSSKSMKKQPIEFLASTESPSIKSRKYIKNLIKEHIGSETSQALVRIFDTKSKGLKVFWVLCLLGCSSLCFYLIAQSLMTYLSYPVYTTSTVVHEIPTQFPKITICNSQFATSKYAYQLIYYLNQQYLPSVNIFDKNLQKFLTFSQKQDLVKLYRIFNILISLNTFSDASRKMLVHPLEDILLDCKFNGKSCSANDFSWRWDPMYGNCYSFNTGFNSSGGKMSYFESVLPGAVFGLKLNLYVGYPDLLNGFNVAFFTNFGSNAPQYGLNLQIENNTYLGEMKSNVIALNGGTANYISIQRKFSSKLPNPYSNCDVDNINPGSFNSEYYNLIKTSPYQYNQKLCITQCMQKVMNKYCNCSMPVFLSLYNDSCKTFGEALCAYYVVDNLIFPIEKTIRNCIPECPLECNSTQFTFTHTSQTYTGMLFSNLVKKNPVFASDFTYTPITEETASNKFVEVNLYYDKLSYTSSEDSPSMDIVALFGSVGGTLGLFLGLSVLSFCEVLHVIFESCIHFNHRITKK